MRSRHIIFSFTYKENCLWVTVASFHLITPVNPYVQKRFLGSELEKCVPIIKRHVCRPEKCLSSRS